MATLIDLVAAESQVGLTQAAAHAMEQAGTAMDLDMQVTLIAGVASLLGALLGALIPAVFTYQQTKRSREDEKGYLAVLVSSALYSYASDCVDVAYDTGEPDKDGMTCISVRSPTLDPLSLDVKWRMISVSLLDRVFALPSAQQIVDGRLSWEAGHDFEYPILERQAEYGKLAIKALAIAHELRQSTKLSPDPDGMIDLMAQMKKHVPALEERLADIQRRRQESMADLAVV